MRKSTQNTMVNNISIMACRLEGQPMFQILSKTQELERQGKTILHFELGDPDFPTPHNIKSAVEQALAYGETHYAPSTGLLELKEAVAESTLQTRHFRPDLNQLLVTAGANIQLFYAIACTVNPGEDVIVPDPGFVSYYSILKMLNINAIRIPIKEENKFRLNPEDVKKAITSKTRMIIINSPSNPTGSMMTTSEIEYLYDIAEMNDLYILSDEVYSRIRYTPVYFSPSYYDHCKERTILVNSFSKSYAMPGFRLGVSIAPSEITEKMGLMLETTSSCVSPFIQRAGIEALKGSQDHIEAMVSELKNRRDKLVVGLNCLRGVSCIVPQGAFYVFPNITKTRFTSQEFTDKMLEAGIAVTPGTVFGEYGEGYIRMSYTTSLANIEKALEIMRETL